ncbi:hypothetical protein HHI36_004185 [Cryptolaemus montrouzieri]|uniref:Tyrosine-protein phosphatase non-receptor type 23 n=1 Tax=Cryptolaemus montrouzieri TaxID=559131 RepID=A0ABD2NQP5_9CUCU
MEAVPRLPMISFELKTSTENPSFGQPLKQYIAQFYGEDPESYNNEIHNLESLRGAAVRATMDVEGIQLLKKYYCQLHFLKSRFPMEENQPASVYFSWKDNYSGLACSIPDIRFELMCILYNIGALHSKLGAMDQRTTPDGMKIACTHFQCAAWAFKVLQENYYQMVTYISSVEIVSFEELVCLAQAQECILEKSMMDNRKATIIAKVAAQVVDYYRRAQFVLKGGVDGSNNSDYMQIGVFKESMKYLNFKVDYHKCISLLYQGQEAEEQQKMGQRVALYQAAADQLEAARKIFTTMDNKQDIAEGLAFTSDVVEGKKKAAKNENDFIYHEEVPSKDTFEEIKGASLVKGTPFSISDVEVSGPDIFARLVPMEAHEASSLYSEKKAEVLRKYGELIENKDQKLAEFMSSMQIDFLNDMRQATGLPQDIVDRAAALSAKPNAIQELITSMTKLSNSYHEVESLLNEIQELLKEEDQSEKEYQKSVGERPPSIIATDLAREAAKYREAHTKANDSNQALHKAMVTHVSNLKTLSQPLTKLQHQIPSVKIPDPNIDAPALREIEMLLGKVEEMKTQRGVLWAQLRDALHKDDITGVLVTRQSSQSIDDIFKQELEKHQQLTTLIEQNASAQENIITAFIEAYAKFSNTRRYLHGIVTKRQSTINSLITSYDSYEDLLAKATKGIEFYTKLETNVTKLLQRIKSSCKVQQEEREQMLSKIVVPKKSEPIVPESNAPKLKDYLDSMKKSSGRIGAGQAGTGIGNYLPSDSQIWPPGVRPAPVGSEINDVSTVPYDSSTSNLAAEGYFMQNRSVPATDDKYLQQYGQNAQDPQTSNQFGATSFQVPPTGTDMDRMLEKRLAALSMNDKGGKVAYQQYNVQDYGNYNYGPYYNNYPTANDMSIMKQPVNSTFDQVPNVPQASTVYNAPASAASYAQHTQYIPTHYQQMNYPSNDQMNYPNDQVQYGHIYASGYATSQNFQNSGVATVQSGGYVNYGTGLSFQAAQPTNVYDSSFNTATRLVSSNNEPYKSSSYPSQPGQDGSTVAGTMSQGYPANLNAVQPYQSGGNIASSLNSTYQSGGNTATSLNNTYQSGGNTATSLNNIYQTNQLTNNYQMPNPDVPQNYPYYQTGYPSYDTVNPNAFPTSQQDQGTYNQQSVLSQYSEGYVGAGLIGQNEINPSSMYTQAGMNYVYNPNNTLSSNGGLTSPQCTHNPTDYSYIPNSTQVTADTPVKKETTLDLLSGLEFSISQIPLEPQQTKSEPEPKKAEEPKPPNVTMSKPLIEPTTDVQTEKKPTLSAMQQFEKIIASKALDSEEAKKLFRNEVDKYEKFVDVLTNKTLNGPTTLDLKWKEIQDNQESEGTKRIISVARCYPMKNRFPDILPYDHSRVLLGSTVDDYINASYIKDISPFVPPVIITQTPLQSTMMEFWTMIVEQRVEFVMCLLSDNEIGTEVYWPTERGKDICFSNMVISLQSVITKKYWNERLITISIPEKREFSTIVHLQFTDWPGSLFPVSPDPFVRYVREFITLYQQQRLHSYPMVIHCSSGIGKSGVACLLVFAILEATNSATLPDLTSLTNKITSFRKNILRDREHLKFAYQAFLVYMKQIISNGNLSKSVDNPIKEDNSSATSTNNDPLNSLDPFWASRREKR